MDNQTNKASNETYLLYLDDLYWSAPFTAGVQPTPRYHHGSSIVKSENNRTYLIILGGLEQSICPMEICYLTETETKENAEWEKLKEMNEQEKLTSELAGNTVIDNKKYIMEIERLIMEEKMKIAENEKERRKFEQILDEKKKSIEDRYNVKIKEEDQIELEKKNLLNGIETMFIMIKQEQMISKEIISKNKLLEGSLQNVQDFMINLDQFANAIMKSKNKIIFNLNFINNRPI